MTEQEHLLTILAEECVETAQRVSKALRFGLEEIQPGQEETNADRIIYEFNDIMAVMEMLQDNGWLPYFVDHEAKEKKKAKVREYMEYAKECGTINAGLNEGEMFEEQKGGSEDDLPIFCKQCSKELTASDNRRYKSFYFCDDKCFNDFKFIPRCEYCSEPLPEDGGYRGAGACYCNFECFSNDMPF